MKKLCLLFSLLVILAFSQTLTENAGPHTLWSGDTLSTSVTKTATPVFQTADYTYLHLWVKTTNPADSTKYRVYYKNALSPTDVFVFANDSTGTALSTTIIWIADTLWHYRAITLPTAKAPYMTIYATAGTGTGGDGHGTRARIWTKVYFSE